MKTNSDDRLDLFACPPTGIWERFLSGDIEHATLDKLAKHLETCEDCVDTLDEISSLPLSPKKSIDRSQYFLEDNCIRLEARLNDLENIDDLGLPAIPKLESPMPESIGRFQIRDILGSGGFGRVYLATDPLLRRSVAIKAPKRGDLGSERDVANFLNEARHAASLEHPAIVPIYDVIEDASGRTLIVMKYIEGQSLSSLLRGKHLAIDHAVQLMMQVAVAVHFANEKGLVHRDLKPSNILLDANNQPHVTDFGLGMNIHDPNKRQAYQGGTPPYMSPEQVRNEVDAIDRRSDVWSLGVMLAEMVHAKRPFPQRDRSELFSAIETNEPLIESTPHTVELDAIIRRCLAKSPADRFSSSDELSSELARWLKRHFPVGVAKWLTGWRRNVAAATIIAILAGSFWMIQSQWQQMELQANLRQLESAPADQIPTLVDRLISSRTPFKSVLIQGVPETESGKLRLALAGIALGDVDTDRLNKLVDLLSAAQPNEVAASVRTLRNVNYQQLLSQLVRRMQLSASEGNLRLPLAAMLAGLDPEHQIWREQRKELANQLVRLIDDEQKQWFPLFDPIGKSHLADPLRESLRVTNAKRSQLSSTTLALAHFLENDLLSLVQLIPDVDLQYMSILVQRFRKKQSESVTQIKQSFDAKYSLWEAEQHEEEGPPTKTETSLAKLAICLWMLDAPEAALIAFRHNPNPTLQTLTIHGLGTQQVASKSVLDLLEKAIDQIEDATTTGVRFSLLQLLSLLPRDSLASDSPPTELLTMLWQSDPDSGVHSSVKLVAERQGIELASPRLGDHGKWRRERIGTSEQDFVVIEPSLGELGIRNPSNTKLLTIPWQWHKRAFTRRIEIATNEVTIQQFREFDSEHFPNDRVLMESAPNAAMMLLDLDVAYRYCNRLSESQGLVPCYELKLGDEEQERLCPKPNHLKLSGFRLPTDAEWELVCRAGTFSSRYFGNVPDLVKEYGWIGENMAAARFSKSGALLSQNVGEFLPNRWGLFDMFGNASELCDMSIDPISLTAAFEDDVQPQENGFRRIAPLIRGCSISEKGASYAHSYIRTNKIILASSRTIGFRLARTLVP